MLTTLGDLAAPSETASYGAVAGLVLLGSIVPVVPTGAVVSAGAALAVHGNGHSPVLVILVAALGAVVGDMVTYGICRLGGRPALQRILRGKIDALDGAVDKLGSQGSQLIIISRLVPAGRIPVLAAAGATAFPWRKFVPADVLACLIWSVCYALLGLIGGNLFLHPWAGALAALAIVLVVNALVHLVHNAWRRRHPAPADEGAVETPVPPRSS